MKISVLVENTRRSDKFGCRHGLSLLVETRRHRILFDMGSDGLFEENARVMGEELSTVDVAVVSHGHSDHGGALARFLACNARAAVYLQREAFGRYYASVSGRMWYVGLEQALSSLPRLRFTDGICRIDDELTLFSADGPSAELMANRSLYMLTDEGYRRDTFVHEHYLLVTEGDETTLLSGCAHRGIAQILRRAEQVAGHHITRCVSGFHLYDPVRRVSESDCRVDELAAALMATGTSFMTCHCTGQAAYERLRKTMGERISRLAAGDVVSF